MEASQNLREFDILNLFHLFCIQLCLAWKWRCFIFLFHFQIIISKYWKKFYQQNEHLCVLFIYAIHVKMFQGLMFYISLYTIIENLPCGLKVAQNNSWYCSLQNHAHPFFKNRANKDSMKKMCPTYELSVTFSAKIWLV